MQAETGELLITSIHDLHRHSEYIICMEIINLLSYYYNYV